MSFIYENGYKVNIIDKRPTTTGPIVFYGDRKQTLKSRLCNIYIYRNESLEDSLITLKTNVGFIIELYYIEKKENLSQKNVLYKVEKHINKITSK